MSISDSDVLALARQVRRELRAAVDQDSESAGDAASEASVTPEQTSTLRMEQLLEALRERRRRRDDDTSVQHAAIEAATGLIGPVHSNRVPEVGDQSTDVITNWYGSVELFTQEEPVRPLKLREAKGLIDEAAKGSSLIMNTDALGPRGKKRLLEYEFRRAAMTRSMLVSVDNHFVVVVKAPAVEARAHAQGSPAPSSEPNAEHGRSSG